VLHIYIYIYIYIYTYDISRLRLNLPPHSTNYKTIATGQLTRLIRQRTAYVLVQRTLPMCFVEILFFFAPCLVI